MTFDLLPLYLFLLFSARRVSYHIVCEGGVTYEYNESGRAAGGRVGRDAA